MRKALPKHSGARLSEALSVGLENRRVSRTLAASASVSSRCSRVPTALHAKKLGGELVQREENAGAAMSC